MAARWRCRSAHRALRIPDVEKPNDERPLDRPPALGVGRVMVGRDGRAEGRAVERETLGRGRGMFDEDREVEREKFGRALDCVVEDRAVKRAELGLGFTLRLGFDRTTGDCLESPKRLVCRLEDSRIYHQPSHPNLTWSTICD